MLTLHEGELMELLWQYPQGLTHVEMIALATQRSWKDSTIHILINGLLEKDMIEVVRMRATGRRPSRVFAPCLSLEAHEIRNIRASAVDMDEAKLVHLFSAFVEANSISASTRQKLLKLLDNDDEG